ncbi:MupG family TIM beta-alpha barrel fold protein [Dubosiella newyorkensis]|uniref:MupG family TIM beta-alpha barrel fold protein n=1 Tax=Dubosiella newyorkensis TaxID=1862672 RepID=UPI003F665FA7
MRRLGISIYPEHASLEENKKYIEQAAKYGFKRIFTCLLSVDKPKEEIKEEFKELIDFAHQNGMEVIMDVAPYVFERLGISYN